MGVDERGGGVGYRLATLTRLDVDRAEVRVIDVLDEAPILDIRPKRW